MLNEATFAFLDAIAEHNTREYFAKVKPLYQEILISVTNLCQSIIDETGIQHEDGRPLLTKDCMFRIYRDARRLKTWDPLYKHHFSFAISPSGKRNMIWGWYIHIESGKSFFGSGIYWLTSSQLKPLRSRLKNEGDEYVSLTQDSTFQKRFGHVHGSTLTNPPRWFDKTDAHIELIKKKQHLVRASYDDDLVLSHNFIDAIINDIHTVRKRTDWLWWN